MRTFPCRFLPSIAVFLDFDFNLLASIFHGASRSKIQISPSEPLDNDPFLIFKILAGFIVNTSIIYPISTAEHNLLAVFKND